MALIPFYKDFEEKDVKFNSSNNYLKIDTKDQFDTWYNIIKHEIKSESYKNKNIYRGQSQAKYKLYNSAQRIWIENDIHEWNGNNYILFLQSLINLMKNKLLFQKVFKYYKLKSNERDFPLLSILQHYGAPTPLMDWTYNIDVALYFGTENVEVSYSSKPIDKYFSVYSVNRNNHNNYEIQNLFGWSKGIFPELSSFISLDEKTKKVFFISDFEKEKVPKKRFKENRPITTYYNLNILPQEGLFLFSPVPDIPIEDMFDNVYLNPFHCVNIKKDLAEYIRRKIEFKGVDSKFIYPDLNNFCANLLNEHLLKTVNS